MNESAREVRQCIGDRHSGGSLAECNVVSSSTEGFRHRVRLRAERWENGIGAFVERCTAVFNGAVHVAALAKCGLLDQGCSVAAGAARSVGGSLHCSSKYAANVTRSLRSEVAGDATHCLRATDHFVAAGKITPAFRAIGDLTAALLMRARDGVRWVVYGTTLFSDIARVAIAIPHAIASKLLRPPARLAVASAHLLLQLAVSLTTCAEQLTLLSAASVAEITSSIVAWCVESTAVRAAATIRRISYEIADYCPQTSLVLEKWVSPRVRFCMDSVPRYSYKAIHYAAGCAGTIATDVIYAVALVGHTLAAAVERSCTACLALVGQSSQRAIQLVQGLLRPLAPWAFRSASFRADGVVRLQGRQDNHAGSNGLLHGALPGSLPARASIH